MFHGWKSCHKIENQPIPATDTNQNIADRNSTEERQNSLNTDAGLALECLLAF